MQEETHLTGPMVFESIQAQGSLRQCIIPGVVYQKLIACEDAKRYILTNSKDEKQPEL